MNQTRASILSFISGICLAMAWCIPCLNYFIFFAFVPLFYLEEEFKANNYQLRIYSFLSFFIWNLMSCWWISQAHFTGMLLIVVINSLLMSIVFSYSNTISHKHNRSFCLVYLIFMLSFEYFNSRWDLQFPWLNIGNSLSGSEEIIQWYEYTGNTGGSLWILVINALIFHALKRKKTSIIIITLIVIIIPISISTYIYNKPIPDYTTKRFALIQSNLDPYTEKFKPSIEAKNSNIFFSKIDSLCKRNVDIILGPETQILKAIDENNKEKSIEYNKLLEIKNNYPNTSFLLGCHSKIYNKNKKGYKLYNSSIYIDKNGISQFYHKNKLVPLFEKIPFGNIFPFLKRYQISIAGSSSIYDSEQNRKVFHTSEEEEIIPLICFESIFSEFTSRKITNTKPSYINIMVNDGWWKNTPGYKHHLLLCKLRAIENRKEIIRTANTGISAHINAKGTIIARTEWWEEGSLVGDIKLYKTRSFYSKYGNYIGFIACIFTCIVLCINTIKYITNKKQ